MTGRTHDLAAFTALSAIVLTEPLKTMTLATALVSVFANLIGGIAPDIDQPTAPFWRNLPVGKYFGRLFGLLNGGHRFLTHSLMGLMVFGVIAHYLLVWLQPVMPHVNIGLVWWSFMIGMLTHLIMDSFTKEGVPWLLPIPVKFGFPPLKRLRVSTGKWFESLVIFPGLGVVNVVLYAHNYPKFLIMLHHYLMN